MSPRRVSLITLSTSAALVLVRIVLALVAGSVAALADATRAAAELGQVLVAGIAAHHDGDRERRPTIREVGAVEGAVIVAAGVVAGFAALRGLGGSVHRPALGAAGMLACAVIARLAGDQLDRIGGGSASTYELASLARTPATAVLAAGGLAVSAMLSSPLPDVAAALLIAAVVVRSGFDLSLTAVRGRERLRGDELARVTEALARGPDEVVGYGHVGARTAAGRRRIDVDVTIVRDVADARLGGIRNEIERAIAARLPGVRIVVHLHKPPPLAGPTGEGRRRRKP